MRRQLLDSVVDDLERHLDRQARFEKLVDELGAWSEARTYQPGEAIVTLAAPREGLHLLTEGRASQFDPSGTRIFQFSPGDVIEPLGAFDPGAATTATIADVKCRTLLLSPAARERLGKTEPDRILSLYEYILTAKASGCGHGVNDDRGRHGPRPPDSVMAPPWTRISRKTPSHAFWLHQEGGSAYLVPLSCVITRVMPPSIVMDSPVM